MIDLVVAVLVHPFEHNTTTWLLPLVVGPLPLLPSLGVHTHLPYHHSIADHWNLLLHRDHSSASLIRIR